MMTLQNHQRAQSTTAELRAAQTEFHALLASLSDDDWHRRSRNPGWTNGEALVHMAMGYFLLLTLLPMIRLLGRLPRAATRPFAALLNWATGPFNWVNGLAPRLGGRLFRRRSLGKTFDWAVARTLRTVSQLRPEEWQRGMWYPSRWDPLFPDYMTTEDLLRYPVVHMRFHVDQLSVSGRRVTPP
jgi:hypothetical protein